MQNTSLLSEDKVLQTDNIYLAASLIYFGYEIISVERTGQRRVIFLFDRSKQTEKLSRDFLSFKLKVEPQTYADSLKRAKGYLYDKSLV